MLYIGLFIVYLFFLSKCLSHHAREIIYTRTTFHISFSPLHIAVQNSYVYEAYARERSRFTMFATLMDPRERPGTQQATRGRERGKRGVKKRGTGRSLLTTRLIRTVLLAFYNETFVSNTDFKKQTFLSRNVAVAAVAAATTRARAIALFSPFAVLLIRSPRAPLCFLFISCPVYG